MKKILASLILALSINLIFASDNSDYTTKDISGFQVKFKKSIEPEVQETLATMEVDLAQISQLFAPDVLKVMQENPIWIRSDIKKGSACYHPGKQWLINNGINPDKAQCVEVVHYKNYIKYRSQNQPFILLHELSHLYHYRVLGAENQDIKDAFNAAKESGTYHDVMLKTSQGNYKKVEKAYAMNNRFEYFAEISEAYFGENDFFPFNYNELKEADPKGFALMEKIWGKRNIN